MKKICLFGLISTFLYVTLILSHVHNHPLTESGDESCPAYIISYTVNGDQLPIGLSDVTEPAFSGTFLALFDCSLKSQTPNALKSNRSPPIADQITESFFLNA